MDTPKNKTIIDLAILSSKLAENFGGQVAKGMDATFKGFATGQLKFFIFAGRDTTASAIFYVYYLLSSHTSVMKRLREDYIRPNHQTWSRLLPTQIPFILLLSLQEKSGFSQPSPPQELGGQASF